ncbi:fluoride efflux transporter FluC [Salininema proteolyticum]|uniref:Fluoride-specific ion channel FluC n=1 Tax=Salininema proteolyticum TaxID=1607685 RepID=A0ABV8TWH8_9ACTN
MNGIGWGRALRGAPKRALLAVSLGGVVGALARYGVSLLFPKDPHHFDVATFLVNVLGGFLIGMLMVFAVELRPGTGYLRPFLGVGVMGGFTSFSAYILDIGRAVGAGERMLAVTYAFTTIAGALGAAALGMYAMRRIDRRFGIGVRE